MLDLHFGKRLRLRRELLDVDGPAVGKMVGLSAAEFAAYEDGRRRFDATLVFRLSKALEVPIYWFYDGLGLVEEILLSVGPDDQARAGDYAAKQVERTQRSQAMMTYFEAMDGERQAVVLDLARLLSATGTQVQRISPA